jgi:hypothetical protein
MTMNKRLRKQLAALLVVPTLGGVAYARAASAGDGCTVKIDDHHYEACPVAQTVKVGGDVGKDHIRGDASLEVLSNGIFKFRGHLHNEGVASFNVTVVCQIPLKDGTAITFSNKGKIRGDIETITGGNKSLDWESRGRQDMFRGKFKEIDTGRSGGCKVTDTAFNWDTVLSGSVTALGVVGGIALLIV